MFKKFAIANLAVAVTFLATGLSIWMLALIVNIPDYLFWTQLLIIGLAPYFIGLAVTGIVGGSLSVSIQKLEEECFFFERFSNKETVILTNAIGYFIAGMYLYNLGIGRTVNGLLFQNLEAIHPVVTFAGSYIILLALRLFKLFLFRLQETATE